MHAFDTAAQLARGLCRQGYHPVGMSYANRQGMAAVLALVMLPIIVAIGVFVAMLHSDASFGAVFAGTVFAALAVGVLFGALRIARNAEGPEHSPR